MATVSLELLAVLVLQAVIVILLLARTTAKRSKLLVVAKDGTPMSQTEAALRQAFAQHGLPLDQFAEDFDVAASGKLEEVVHTTSLALGKLHPIRTVGDIARLMQGL